MFILDRFALGVFHVRGMAILREMGKGVRFSEVSGCKGRRRHVAAWINQLDPCCLRGGVVPAQAAIRMGEDCTGFDPVGDQVCLAVQVFLEVIHACGS